MRAMTARLLGLVAGFALALSAPSAAADEAAPIDLPTTDPPTTDPAAADSDSPAGRSTEGLVLGGITFRPTLGVRVRGEYRRSPVDLGGDIYASSALQADGFRSAAPTVLAREAAVRDAILLSERVRLGLDATYGRVSARVTLQDARVLGVLPGATTATTPPGSGVLEPYEAYLDARSDEFAPTFEVRVGRQAVSWGEGRLLGVRDWWQRGATLDAVRVRLHVGEGLTDVELLAAVLAAPSPLAPPAGVNGTPVEGTGAQLFGLRNAWHVFPLLHVEASGLARLARDPLPVDLTRGDTVTADLRISGAYRGVSYSAEGAYQLGRVAGFGANREVRAFAGAGRVDWQTALPLALRFGASGSYASGDPSSGQGRTMQRFDPIRPDVHRHHGMMDLVAWSNLIDGAASVGARPASSVDASVRYAFLGLARPNDRWTTANLLPVGVDPTNTARVLGHELDARVSWMPLDGLTVDGGYGLLLTGEGARNILAAAGRGEPELLHFGYLQAAYRVP